MMTTKAAKKRNTPHCMLQSIERNDWPMTKENRKLTNTVMDWPAARVSSGWISDGTSQPSGPLRRAQDTLSSFFQQSTCRTFGLHYLIFSPGAGTCSISARYEKER